MAVRIRLAPFCGSTIRTIVPNYSNLCRSANQSIAFLASFPSVHFNNALSSLVSTPPSSSLFSSNNFPSTLCRASFSTTPTSSSFRERSGVQSVKRSSDSESGREKRKTTPGDPTGRRAKDKVPADYELIAATEGSQQMLIPIAGYGSSVAWLFAVFKFCTQFIPDYLSRGKYFSLLDVIFSTDYHLLLVTSLVFGTFIVGAARYVVNRYMLRMYMNRQTEEYCVVNQGYLGPRRHFFTYKDVRIPVAWDSRLSPFQPNYILKGRGYYIDVEEFKNLRDFNHMIRLAKKLQPLD